MDNDSDSDVGDILNDLLANDDAEEQQEPPKKAEALKELNFNFLDSTPTTSNENKPSDQQKKSEVYDDTLDSSDDEDRRCFEEQNYSNYGRDIKSLLRKEASTKNEGDLPPREPSRKTFDFNATQRSTDVNTTSNGIIASKDVYSDPYFGLRIVSPVVSSTELKARMDGKIPVTIARVKHHITSDKMESDWVIAGVLVSKSLTKTSQKGSSYSIWKISDLSENIDTVCLFMFSGAYKTHWKTTIGTVMGVLNPKVLESRENNDLATLSVDNPQKIMILGKSKDMGKCRSTKNNGEPCSAIVNIRRCEFCVYHVKREYKTLSKRADLQAFKNTQKFSIDMLKQKNQLRKPLETGMPEFHAVVAVKSRQLEEKDAKRLALLSGSQMTERTTNLKCNTVESPGQQIKRDFEVMHRSRGWRAAALSQSSSTDKVVSPSSALLKSNSCKQKNVEKKDLSMLSSLSSKPHLGVGCLGGMIDLSEPITKKHINRAKSNAIKWVQKNGTLKSKNPNKVKLDKDERLEKGKKRPRESESSEEREAKKGNVLPDKFKEMMQAKSAHTDLIEKSYEQEEEKYFNKLEMKERMEEKMLTTYKVACKAVKCLVCKYTSFSASDICKEQKHPLRVADAVKRFFKCGDCGNRTVSLDRIPSHSCIKCSSSSWRRAAMMDERKTHVHVTALSIRGDEETHIGSASKEANLNLLVPDSDHK